MKVTDASTYRIMQTNLNRNAQKLQDLYQQGSTGLKLNTASDNPGAIQPVLSSRNQITLAERFLTTLGVSSDNMASIDTNLATIENVFQRASEIAVNAVNSTLSEKDLATLADEVDELKKQMFDIANAQIDGKYIFAGYSVTEQPFVENPNYDPALYDEGDSSTWPVIYNGDSNRTTLEIGEGEYLDVNLTGNELFLGIENDEYQNGNGGLSGSTIASSGPLVPGGAGDIVIDTPDGTVTIPESYLVDTGVNYAARVAGLIETGPTNAGNMAGLADFNQADGDSYQLTVDANTTPITITLDGTVGQEFSLQGAANALGATAGATNVTATSGTLANGIQYDISSGELLFSHVQQGTAINLSETVNDGVPANGPAHSGFLPATTVDTGLRADITPASRNLGDMASVATQGAADTYSLGITSESSTVNISLTGPSTLQDIAIALEATGATDVSYDINGIPVSGTLSNGVSFDISGGTLQLTGNENGADLELTDATSTAPIIGTTTDYGTVDITADTTKDVTVSGAGLANAGLNAGTVTGSVTIDIFGVLTRLEESLRAGNLDDPDGTGGSVQEAITNLDLAADQNRRKRSQLGVKAMRVDDAIEHLEGSLIDIRSTLSRYEDADITQTYNDILMQETAWKSALSVTGRISRISILDYL